MQVFAVQVWYPLNAWNDLQSGRKSNKESSALLKGATAGGSLRGEIFHVNQDAQAVINEEKQTVSGSALIMKHKEERWVWGSPRVPKRCPHRWRLTPPAYLETRMCEQSNLLNESCFFKC